MVAKVRFFQQSSKNTAAKVKTPAVAFIELLRITVSMLWPLGRLLFHRTLSQTHSEDGNWNGQYQGDNQHRDIVNDRFHQLIISGRHFLHGSGKRTFSVRPPI